MPLFWLSLAFLTGILLAANVPIPIIIWIAIAVFSLLLLLPPVYKLWSHKVSRGFIQISGQLKIPHLYLYPLIILLISLGGIRYIISRPVINSNFIAYYNDQPGMYRIEGVLAEPPDVRDTYANLRIQVKKLSQVSENKFIPVSGLLLARIPPGTVYHYADRIQLQGRIQTPAETEDFSYRNYLAHQGIYSNMYYPSIDLVEHENGNPLLSFLYGYRERALSTIYHLFPDPEASLIAGIILGMQSGIPSSVQEAFRLTGTSHIIVISGFNITIIAAFLTLLFSRIFGRYRGAILAAIGIIFYTLLVGANAAVVRAAILGMLSLLGHLVGRRQTGMNSLTFVAGVMAIFAPTLLWDVSFQLSFAATLGIMLYAEPMTDWFTQTASRFIGQDKADKLAGPVGEYFIVTVAAQLTTLPLMIYYFNRLSLTALIANPLILPAQPPLMVLGGLAVLAGSIIQPIGQLFAWFAWPFTTYTIRMVEWLATIPHGSIALGQVTLPVIISFYAVLSIVTFFHAQIKSMATEMTPAISLALLGVATVLIWKSAFYAPDGKLHITILDVGTGEGLLIQSPAGRYVLINGGPSATTLSDALGRRLPPFYRSLDWLVVADIDDEDILSIPSTLARFTPRNVLWAGNTYGTRGAMSLWSEMINLSISVTTMQAGQALDLGSGIFLRVVSTDVRGAVLTLEWDNFRFVLPLGMGTYALESLKQDMTMRSISALLLPESGYAPLNPPELISALHPQLAILSVAAGDKSGLPSPETIELLKGYNLVRTDQNGWIQITTDGKQMWVEVERK